MAETKKEEGAPDWFKKTFHTDPEIIELLEKKKFLYFLARKCSWVIKDIDLVLHEGTCSAFVPYATICHKFPTWKFDPEHRTPSVTSIEYNYILQDEFGCLVFNVWHLKKIAYYPGIGTCFFFENNPRLAGASMSKDIYDLCLKDATLARKVDLDPGTFLNPKIKE